MPQPELPTEPARSASAQVATAGTWGFAGRGTLVVANLLATPFVLRLLGPSKYGLWALVQSVLTSATLSEFGMSTATTKLGTERYASGDGQGEARVVWSAVALGLVVTGSLAVALAVGAPSLLRGLLVHDRQLLGQGTTAVRLGCATLVLSVLADIFNTPQLARLQWRRFTVLNTGANLLAIVGTPLALLSVGGGVTTAAAMAVIAAAVYALSMFRASTRVQPALWHPQVSMSTLRQLVPYGAALTVVSLAALPLSTGERFVLASNHSTMVVAYYAVAATVATVLNILPEQIGAPLLPGLASLRANGRLEEMRSLYRTSLAGVFLVATPAAVVLGLVAQPFLSLWAGPAYGAHSTVPLLIALAGVWAEALAVVPTAYLLTSGWTNRMAFLNAAQILPYLAAAWLLTDHFGARGAALVWSARLLVSSAALFAMAWRAARLPVLPLSERRARSVLAPAAFAVVCVGAAAVSRGLAERCGLAVALGAGYAAVAWWLVLSARERKALSVLVSSIIGRSPRGLLLARG